MVQASAYEVVVRFAEVHLIMNPWPSHLQLRALAGNEAIHHKGAGLVDRIPSLPMKRV